MARNILHSVFAVFGLFVVGLILVGFFPLTGVIIIGLVALGTIALAFKPELNGRITSRIITVPVAIVAVILTFSSLGQYWNKSGDNAKLAELKQTDPHAYLKIIKKSKSENFWLKELESLDPESYQKESVRIAAERKSRITQLEAEARKVPASKINENLRIYRQLQSLDPTNERYEQKIAHYSGKKNEVRKMLRHPERYVKVASFSWRKKGFDNVMELDITIENMLPVQVKDIEIKCTHTAPSGTIIDQNKRIIYEIISSGRKRTFRKINMGFIHSQANRSSCSVVRVTRIG